MRKLDIGIGAFLCLILVAAAPETSAHAEIGHLLDYLEKSGCQFYRNGSWHAAPAARRHLDKKYRYLLDKNLIQTSEDFIERAAATSSLSGEAYRVRCGAAAAVTSAQWLTEELRRYRGAARATAPAESQP